MVLKKKFLCMFIIILSLSSVIDCFADNLEENTDDNEKQKITAIAAPEEEPYISFVNGYAVGIIPDVVALFEDSLKVEIDIIETESFEQYINYINSGKYDIVLDAVEDEERAYFDNYNLSEPYIDENYYRIRLRKLDSRATKAAIANEHSLCALYAKQFYYPEQVKFYDSIDDCLDAIKNGDCTEVVTNSFIAEKIVNDDFKNKYIANSFNGRPIEICLAANKNLGDGFIDSINNIIGNLDQSQIANIISLHTLYVKPQMSIIDKLYYNPAAAFLLIFSAAITIISLFIIIFISRKHIDDKRQKELLQAALANAENANNAKGQFLARMSHEIRTPMNAIVGLVALAKDNADDKKRVHEYLEKIDSASSILLSLLNDVLDMSAIESNKFNIANSKFNFKNLINGISSMYYSQCNAQNVEFKLLLTDVTEELLIGDSLRLSQILINLLSNAVKFTDEGGSVTLNVVQTSKTDEKVYMKFIVSDTGCGMNEDMLSRIFKPFEQESTYNTRKYGGSGLGLSIVKGLVDMMQGAITVESVKDEGTTFTVDMPFGASDETSSDQIKKFSSVRALLISNDEKNCEFTLAALKSVGIEFDIANCSDKAVEILNDAHANEIDYDICFIDCEMNGLCCIDLTKRIRKNSGDRIVIVVISAFYTLEAESDLIDAGADMFVTKPVYQPTVFNILMALSEKRKNIFNNTPQYDFSGYKVLMAEDNKLNREIAVALLENVNLTVDCSSNGQEAVDMFLNSKEGEYTAVLMDIQMPVMDGYEASKTIRASKHPDAQTVPIYAMTANAFTEDVTAALSSGMNGHISKPIDTKTLYEAIKESINKQD